MSNIDSIPTAIIMHPDNWRRIRAILLYHETFRRLIKREWRTFKTRFRPNWHSRAVQRNYVRHVESMAWAQVESVIN